MLVTYEAQGALRLGALRGEEIVDLSRMAASMLELIDLGKGALEAARAIVEDAEAVQGTA